jgi:hypothetical protein
VDCGGTRPVACCKLDENCTVKSKEQCLADGGTVSNEDGNCNNVTCPFTPTWICNQSAGNCTQTGGPAGQKGAGYQDAASCNANCKNYTCAQPGAPGQQGICTQQNAPGYVNEDDCINDCQYPATYNCNGCVCTLSPDGTGQFTTFDACKNNCSTCVNCVNGTCVSGIYDGRYRDTQECLNDGCETPPNPTGSCCVYNSTGSVSCVDNTTDTECTSLAPAGGTSIFNEGKTCSEITNCINAYCCCSDATNFCALCPGGFDFNDILQKCANCTDFFGNSTTLKLASECQG